jgi:ribonuclease BN (tRNA processing enzyme)
VRLRVVGSSPAWPNPGSAQSGYLVDGRLLIDCGSGVMARLRAAEAWSGVEAIVLTHLHPDHWADVVPWVWGRLFGVARETPRPQLLVPDGGRAELEAFASRFGTDGMFDSAFEIREYGARGFETLGYRVETVSVPHYGITTYALRIEDGASTFAFSADSSPAPELAAIASAADLFLCEATLERGDLDYAPRGHLAADEAIDAFEASGARRLLLTHRPTELAAPDGAQVAWDGLELEV